MKDDKVFLSHILDEVVFVLRETKDLKYEDLTKDEVLKRALIRSLEVIGEATKNLSEDFRKKHSEVLLIAGDDNMVTYFGYGCDHHVCISFMSFVFIP